MKKVFFVLLTLLFAWELYGLLPDLLAVKVKDVKVLYTACIEKEDGLFYPHVTYEGGEELLHKEGFNNPEKCEIRYSALKDKSLSLYRKALGGITLDPSISYKTFVHLFLLLVATLYVYIRFP